MEMETALTVLVGAIGSAKVLEKLFGPTADYLGGGLRNYTEKGFQNLRRIFKHAETVLGDEIEEPGQVPAKVLKEILQEGYFCEDELSAQYFGGVLASSRSGVSRDDRGAYFISLIGRLSVYQIRTHYIFYSVFRNICSGRTENLGLSSERHKFRIFVPWLVYDSAMDYQAEEIADNIATHALTGLAREGLIGEAWSRGSADHLKSFLRFLPEKGGIGFTPSAIGMQLYMWAHGVNSHAENQFLSLDMGPKKPSEIVIPEGAQCLSHLNISDATKDQEESKNNLSHS
jgi:hypothetical protein